MSATAQRCPSCGSTDLDVDHARADVVCTNCGNVLESSCIVSDVQFEENAHGGSNPIGSFVSADSKGGHGPGGFSMHCGVGKESKEITLKRARMKIVALAQQLHLTQVRIDMAFNFFKMAYNRHLTRGRKSMHVIAACVYITCRTEGTSHMLIDFSDILQIDVYELGRTYLRLSQALCINIPAMDPCLYVMRFANKLQFEDKTHEVSMTALRLVSRMKKDWMHFGRRPSGLCGAALLIASRLHEFHRSVGDVVKVVKVHESTLRKRLNEFGETPASQLTLDEFMNIDLDAMTEEQDPPSFKAARRKDKERLQKLEDEGDIDNELSELEQEIERELEERRSKLKGGAYSKLAKETATGEVSSNENNDQSKETQDTEKFIAEQTLGTISDLLGEGTSQQTPPRQNELDSILMPPPTFQPKSSLIPKEFSPGMGLKDTIREYLVSDAPPLIVHKEEDTSQDGDEEDDDEDCELDLTGIDDDEIDGYIMTDTERQYKTELWMKVNAEYLKEKAEKEERERREAEEAEREGRVPKKKKKSTKKPKVNLGANQTAIEAIEKIVQERKISTKINYDVLRSLNSSLDSKDVPPLSSPVANGTPSPGPNSIFGDSPVRPATGLNTVFRSPASTDSTSPPAKRSRPDPFIAKTKPTLTARPKKKTKEEEPEEDHREVVVETGPVQAEPIVESGPVVPEEPLEEEDDDDDTCLSAAELLSKHRGETGIEDDYYEEDYY